MAKKNVCVLFSALDEMRHRPIVKAALLNTSSFFEIIFNPTKRLCGNVVKSFF
jgi:hypothetical protein